MASNSCTEVHLAPTSETGAKTKVGCCANVCPCCCHPDHKRKPTPVSIAGCLCWFLIGFLIVVCIWALLTFVVIQNFFICPLMANEKWPEESWLKQTVEKDPSNFDIVGSQKDTCHRAKASIDLKDWRFDESEYEEVFFESTDGLKLQGFFFQAKSDNTTRASAPKDAPTILIIHGHGHHIATHTEMIPAKFYQQLGFNVFAINNQGLGKSQNPHGDFAVRTFGADELTNTEGAIKLITENLDGNLPFATPLERFGLHISSGANGMIWFFRKNIPGIVMHGSIYDWYLQWQVAADGVNIGWIPMVTQAIMNCATTDAQRGGIAKENFKDHLDREVHDPSGRQVLLIHEKSDTLTPFEMHAEGWERDLIAKGFDVETYFLHEPGEEDCSNHICTFWDVNRKKHFEKVCEFWKDVFRIDRDCDGVLAFDTKLEH